MNSVILLGLSFPGTSPGTLVLQQCCIEHKLVFYLHSGYGQITNEENYEGQGDALSHLLCLALSCLALGADRSHSAKVPSLAGPKTFTKHLNN